MRDDHVAALAHELRSSLSVILGFARTLEERDAGLSGGERAELLSGIVNQASRLGCLTGNVLAVSRGIGRSAARTLVEPVLRAVVAEATGFPEPRRVRLHVEPGLDTHMDGDALRVVASNLLANALRFAAAGSRVEVSGHHRAGSALVQVRNVGPPIPPDALPHIFDPFVSGVTPDDPAPGFGYGLHVVRTLVELHGGRVTAESTGQGVMVAVGLGAAEPELSIDFGLREVGAHAAR